MNFRHRIVVISCILLGVQSSVVLAQETTWRCVTDSEGCSWARVLITNHATIDSNWSISGCRTAVASDNTSAVADLAQNWDGVVEAESEEFVWIYGKSLGAITVSNADGGASAFYDSYVLDEDSDGQLTIVIAKDGTATVTVELTPPYACPAVAGQLPN